MSKDEDLGDIVSNPQINANALQSEAKKKAAANRLYGHWFALTVISTILLLLQAVGIGYFTRGFLRRGLCSKRNQHVKMFQWALNQAKENAGVPNQLTKLL